MRTSKSQQFRGVLVAGLALLAVLTACSGEPPAVTAGEPVSPSPATSVATPTKATDLARLETGLLTVKDLGSPWLKQKSVRRTGASGEACPGVPNAAKAAPPLAAASANFVEGSKKTASLLISGLDSYADSAALERWRTAAAAARKACATYRDAAKLYVVLESVDPPQLRGADEVVAQVERIYYDQQQRKLAYVRHYMMARTGRLVVSTQHAFLVAPSDKTGRKLDTITDVTQAQLTKAAAAFHT